MAGVCMMVSGMFMTVAVSYDTCRARCVDNKNPNMTYIDTEYAGLKTKMTTPDVAECSWDIAPSSVHSLNTLDGV